MIGIDTNVLVRLQDDLSQSRATTQVTTKQCTRDDPGFINRIVLCNSSGYRKARRVFKRHYSGRMREAVAKRASSRLRMRGQRGMPFVRIGRERADDADCFPGTTNWIAGCDSTITFDKAAIELEGF